MIVVGIIKPSLFKVTMLFILVLGANVDVTVRFLLSEIVEPVAGEIVEPVAAFKVLSETPVP